GAFRTDPRLAAIAASGVVLSATYMLWMFQRVNYGPVTNEKNALLADLRPREWFVIAPVIAAAVLMGVFPNLFLRPIAPAVARMPAQTQRGSVQRVQARIPGPALPVPLQSPASSAEPRVSR